jgi:cell division protein FtsB
MPDTPADIDERVATALARRQRRDRRTGHALVFVGCALLANALVGEGGLVATIKAREAYRRASEGLARIEAENAGLREQARRLESDPATIEIYARRDLHLIKRGEILVQVQDMK